MRNLLAEFEDVTRETAGVGPGGLEFVTVRHGRLRRPESVAQWREWQVASLCGFARWPAGRVIIELLSAPEDANVKTAGRDLDPWSRSAVLRELRRLEAAARETYPPAARVVGALAAAWLRQWGDREQVPPRDRVIAPERGRERPPILAETGIDAGRAGAAWAALGAARRRVLAPA